MESKKLLLVEDDPNDIDLIKRALQKANIKNELIIATDGVEALNYFFGDGNSGCSSNDLPAVVLLDLKLPKVNGFEVLRRIRSEEKTKLIPTVVPTSSNEEKDIIMSYNHGANSFVRKPVRFDEFIEAIRLIGLYWLVINQPTLKGISNI